MERQGPGHQCDMMLHHGVNIHGVGKKALGMTLNLNSWSNEEFGKEVRQGGLKASLRQGPFLENIKFIYK